MKLYKGSCAVVGRKSSYSLYDYDLATYDATDGFDHDAAKGFIELHALTCKVWAKNRISMGAKMSQFNAVASTADEFTAQGSVVVEEAEAVTKDAAATLA